MGSRGSRGEAGSGEVARPVPVAPRRDPLASRISRSRTLPLLAGCLVGLAVAGNLVWGHRDKGPPGWDDALYEEKAFRLFDALVDGGLKGGVRAFLRDSPGKPHFLGLASIPFLFLFGRDSPLPFLLTVSSALGVGAYYAFRLARRLTNPFGGLVATALLCTMPSVIGLSRFYLVEGPLLAVVCAWHFHIVQGEGFSRPRSPLLLGSLLGIGMLLKVSFPIYVAGSLATYLALHARRRGPARGKYIRTVFLGTLGLLSLFLAAALLGRLEACGAAVLLGALALGLRRSASGPAEATRWLQTLLVGCAIAGPWFTVNFASMVQISWSAGFGTFASLYHMPLPRYLAEVASFGISNLQLLFLLVGGVALAGSRRGGWPSTGRESLRRSLSSAPALAVALWFALPFPVLMASSARTYRYLVPSLPAVAIAGGWLAAALLERRPRFAATWLLAHFALANGLVVAFSAGVRPLGRIALGPWVFWDTSLGWTQRPPAPMAWPHETVVRECAVLLGDGRGSGVPVFSNTYSLNWLNLQLAATRQRIAVRFEQCDASLGPEADLDRFLRSGLFLLKEGGETGPEWSEPAAQAMARRLVTGEWGPVEKVRKRDLPDGGSLLFYRRDDDALRARVGGSPCRVEFGGLLALAWVGQARHGESHLLALQWELLEDVVEDHAVFLHVVDRRGEVLSGDYGLGIGAAGDPGWPRGTRILHVRRIPQSGAADPPVTIVVGLYRPRTWERLPVRRSTEPLSEDGWGIVLPWEPDAVDLASSR